MPPPINSPPLPTTSQIISTITHHQPKYIYHHPPPSTTTHCQPNYIHHDPPTTTTTHHQPEYIHHHPLPSRTTHHHLPSAKISPPTPTTTPPPRKICPLTYPTTHRYNVSSTTSNNPKYIQVRSCFKRKILRFFNQK